MLLFGPKTIEQYNKIQQQTTMTLVMMMTMTTSKDSQLPLVERIGELTLECYDNVVGAVKDGVGGVAGADSDGDGRRRWH